MQKDVLAQFVDVWKTTLLPSRRASSRSRHVESHPGLDLGHADRYPLSLVYPVVVGGRVGLSLMSGGGQVGAAQAQRRWRVQVRVWSVSTDRQTGWMSGSGGGERSSSGGGGGSGLVGGSVGP